MGFLIPDDTKAKELATNRIQDLIGILQEIENIKNTLYYESLFLQSYDRKLLWLFRQFFR